jgi:hypothetical protein
MKNTNKYNLPKCLNSLDIFYKSWIQRNCSTKLIIPLKHIFTYRDKKMRGDCPIANRNKMFYLLSALLLSRT